MIRPIVTVPEKRLRRQSLPVDPNDPKLPAYIQDLIDTLVNKNDPPGVGLSAIQIDNPVRIFVTLLPPVSNFETTDKDTPPAEIKVFINPEIIDKSEEMTLGPDPDNPNLEGCLSVPTLYGPVLRHHTIKVKYQALYLDDSGDSDDASRPVVSSSSRLFNKVEVFSNFFARVIQHEYDHLNGILFTDYIIKDKEDLFFDNGHKLISIPQPKKLVTW